MRHGAAAARPCTSTSRRPHVDWSAGAVRLLTETAAVAGDRPPRRAGVSSFGISGTNAHVILEQAAGRRSPTRPPRARRAARRRPCCRGCSRPAPRRRCAAQAAAAARGTCATPGARPGGDVGWSLATTRSRVRAPRRRGRPRPRRAARRPGRARRRRPGRRRGRAARSPAAAPVASSSSPARARSGPAWPRSCSTPSPVFAARIAECAAGPRAATWTGRCATCCAAPTVLAWTGSTWCSPLLFAVMVVAGRAVAVAAGSCRPPSSATRQGEIAAACVAGALSPRGRAPGVVALRSRALRRWPAAAGWCRSRCPRRDVERAARPVGPGALRGGGQRPVRRRRLRRRRTPWTSSPPVRREGGGPGGSRSTTPSTRPRWSRCATSCSPRSAGISPRAATVPFCSTVTGDRLDTDRAGRRTTGTRNLRRDRCASTAGVRAARRRGPRHLRRGQPAPGADRGTHCADRRGRRRSWSPAPCAATRGGLARFLAALAAAHVAGVPVDWAAVFAGRRRPPVDLPTYAFQRQRFWLDAGRRARDAAAARPASRRRIRCSVRRSPLAGGDGCAVHRPALLATQPWLADHAVAGRLLPGTALVELAVRAGDQAGCDRVEELTLEAPLVLPAAGGVAGPGRAVGPARTTPGTGRSTCTPGRRRRDEPGPGTPTGCSPRGTRGPGGARRQRGRRRAPSRSPLDGLYDRGSPSRATRYGPAFRGLRAAWRLRRRRLRRGAPGRRRGDDRTGFAVHPALLDAALHAVGPAYRRVPADVPARPAWRWTAVHAGPAPPCTRTGVTTPAGRDAVPRWPRPTPGGGGHRRPPWSLDRSSDGLVRGPVRAGPTPAAPGVRSSTRSPRRPAAPATWAGSRPGRDWPRRPTGCRRTLAASPRR